MKLDVGHLILYILALLGVYLSGYWAGNRSLLDSRVRPLFAAFNMPLLYTTSSVPPATVIAPNPYIGAQLAPVPSTIAPVPLVTLAAANEMPITDYAPF